MNRANVLVQTIAIPGIGKVRTENFQSLEIPICPGETEGNLLSATIALGKNQIATAMRRMSSDDQASSCVSFCFSVLARAGARKRW